MKHIVKSTLCLSALVGAMLVLFSCEQDAILKKYVYPMPEVSESYPARGYVTQTFTILGNNFGDRTEPVSVFFGGVPVKKVISCKNNCIVVEVPEDAVNGDVTLKIWTNPEISVGTFEAHQLPTLISVASNNEHGPAIAAAGDEVVITGTNFGTNTDKVSVKFNGTPAEITSLEDSKIVAITPDDYDSGLVTVTISEYTEFTLTGSKLVNPAKPGDVTALYLKNCTRPFVQVPYLVGQEGNRTMAIPAEWTVSPEARMYYNSGATDRTNAVGGMFPGDDALGMQTGWAGGGISTWMGNGKMYQTSTVTPGVYQLAISCIACNVNAKGASAYIIVNAGEGLPNVADVNAGTASPIVVGTFVDGGKPTAPIVTTLNFRLEEETQISIGFIATFNNDTFFKVSDVQLNLVEIIE